MSPLPAYLLGGVVLAYWGCVVVKIIRAARKLRGVRAVLVPKDGVEKGLWVLWIPTILAWISLPFVIPNQSGERRPWLAFFDLPISPVIVELARWLAVIAAAVLLCASVHCWRYMGRTWRLGVDSGQTVLLTGGPFRWSRHPIYALGLGLMVCTIVAVPSPALLVVALAHVTLIHWKSHIEERFLLAVHGDLYEDYRRHTGRFVPRLRTLARQISPRST